MNRATEQKEQKKMKQKRTWLLLAVLLFLSMVYASQLAPNANAANVWVNQTEVGLNYTINISGSGFLADFNYTMTIKLEPNSSWWDGYNEQWGMPINVTTRSDGNFSYIWTVPFDFRTSEGRQTIRIGEQLEAGMPWYTQGTNWTNTIPHKFAIIGENTNGFIFTSSAVNTALRGGVEKINKINGSVECNYTYGTAGVNIVGLAHNGTILQVINTNTSGNLMQLWMTNCSFMGQVTTSATGATSIIASPDNTFVILTYAASMAPRKYLINQFPPVNDTTFQGPVIAYASNASCISPNSSRVYVGYVNGNITALNSTGAIMWNRNIHQENLNYSYQFGILGMDCDNESIYVARRGVTVSGVNNQGFVDAINVSDGSLLWTMSKTNTPYDGSDVLSIRCDANWCYAIKDRPTITTGVAASPIVQINKTNGKAGWQKWRSWLPTPYVYPALNITYGNGSTHSQLRAIWVDTNLTGYIYPVYTNGWVEKISKADINAEDYTANATFWIRGATNYWNYIADVPKNVWLSNETPYYVFRHWSRLGQPLDANDTNALAGSFFRYSMLSSFDSISAYEYSVASVLGNSVFIDPVIMTATSTMKNSIVMWNATYPSTNCPRFNGMPLFGWHYEDRSCHYEEIRANMTSLNGNKDIGTTINGTMMPTIVYALVKTKFWENYPITKYYGTNNWAWAAWYNKNISNQTLGFATKFGADQEDVYGDPYGRAVLFINNGTTRYYRPQFRADNNRKTDNYIFFLPQHTNYTWQYVDIETQKIANPINIIQSTQENNWFYINGSIYGSRINFTAQEPNLLDRVNEPVEIIMNSTTSIRPDCQDIIVTDADNNTISFWQVDNSTACTINTNISLWIMMNWTRNEIKELKIYYNSTNTSIEALGQTDLIVKNSSGSCANNNQTINVTSLGWYNWTNPAANATASENTYYKINTSTIGVPTSLWVSAATHYEIVQCYKNSNTTGTGAGASADTCSAARTIASNCWTTGATGKIFAKINASGTLAAVTARPANASTLNVEYYFFANNGRVRIRTQLTSPLDTINYTVSRNWPPYYYLSIANFIPPNGTDSWLYYSGLYEQMKRPAAVLSADLKEANLSAGPLPLLFTIKYGGLDNITQSNGSLYRPATLTKTFWGKGCTAHKMWQYYNYPVALGGPGAYNGGTATAPLYQSEFISCSRDVAPLVPQMNTPGYVNAFPEMMWYGTSINRWYDPFLIGKFYLKPNLYRPYNRENKFLTPYATTNPYNSGANSRISSYIIPKCPIWEHGYLGYTDYLEALPTLLANTSLRINSTQINLPCAAQIIKFADNRGSDGQQIIFARNMTVIVGEIAGAGINYPNSTYTSNGYVLQPNGVLDLSYTLKGSLWAGYFGKWYFTSTPNNYVMHVFTTSGNPQFSVAPSTVTTAATAYSVRYAFSPDMVYAKRVFDMTPLWDNTSQNFTYFLNPCYLSNYQGSYGSPTGITPGWQVNNLGGAAQTCPRSGNNKEIYASFRPGFTSQYPTSALAGYQFEIAVDGKTNLQQPDIIPGGDDTQFISRHNALWDDVHSDDYNSVLSEYSSLTLGTKNPNKNPWYCQTSEFMNRSFCVMTQSSSSLIYNYDPGKSLYPAQSWSPYWQTAQELSMFEDWYANRWFDTGTWLFDFNHYLDVDLFPTMGSTELMFANLLMISNDSKDYQKWFNKPFPKAFSTFKQDQFLLDNWANNAFIVFGENTRTYNPGRTFNITGVVMVNGTYLNNTEINISLYSDDGVLAISNTTTTDIIGEFSWNCTLPESLTAGLFYVKTNYNNGTFTDTTPFKISNLIATITNDKAAYEQGETVLTTVSVKNSLTDESENPDQLKLIYYKPDNSEITCAKYPSTAVVSGCANNLTVLGIGEYGYNITLGSTLGTYTVTATVTDEGVSADYSTQFVVAIIDLCKANSAYLSSLGYPMSYNNITDVLTVIGNSTMGTSGNPITMTQMYEFSAGTRGTCIMENPATGTYTIKSRLVIGNGTQEVHVLSKGEAVSFTSTNMSQLVINSSGYLTFGSVIDGVPQEGCNVKFASNTSNDTILDLDGGNIAFYDSYVTDAGTEWGIFKYRGSCGNTSQATYSAANSSITIKKTIFDRTARGQYFYTGNTTIDDMKLNRINSSANDGFGIVAGCTLPTLNNLQIYHQEQNGSGIKTTEDMPANTTTTITSSTFAYNLKDVIASKDGRGVQLINTIWNRYYDFNWTDTWAGTTTIQESYGYLPNFVDASNAPVENLSLKMRDQQGNIQYAFLTNSTGEIGEQNIKTWQVEKADWENETATEFNPYTVYYKKYGKNFIKELKTLSVRTVETKQIATNTFTNLDEDIAKAQTGITYTPPATVTYGTETQTGYTTAGTLDNSPITQSEYLAIFGYDGTTENTRLNLITGTPDANGEYSIDYATGDLTFFNDQTGYTVTPVYSYGGNITITGNKTTSEIYDYLQANQSDVFTTGTGSTYTSYVDIIIGNSTETGAIKETTEMTLNFKEGYGFSAGSKNGSTINLQSDTWQFTWKPDNGTFNRQYSFDLKVIDANGLGISGATATLTDINSETAYTGTTNTTGHIPKQYIAYATYNSSDGNTPDIKTSHTLSIIKSPYTSYSGPVVLTTATDLTIPMSSVCDPDTTYSYAQTYPMTYDNVTDTLTVIGNSTMGTANNPITFEHMYEFAKATKGTCIIQKPALGTYAVQSRLILGNGTQELNVESKGEAISFSSENMPQLLINTSASLAFGSATDGVPQEGCSVKFASNQTNDIMLDVAGGGLAFYDSYISDVGDEWGQFVYRGSCGTGSTYATTNSSITIKKTIFDRAARGQYFYTGNTTIDDMKLNRINSSANDGFGIVAGCALPTLNNLQIYHQEQNGSGIKTTEDLPANTTTTITSSTFAYNLKDVIASKDGRGVQLINTIWNRYYGFNWTDTWVGTTQIKESYSYIPTIEDSSGTKLVNTSIITMDTFGNVLFSLMTDSLGTIPEQYVPTWQTEKDTSATTETSFNPYRLLVKNYYYKYITESKSFATKTVETKQVALNTFVSSTPATVLAFTDILYNQPTKISYGDETNSSWAMSGQLNNYPVDSCQYFALFADGIKLAPSSNYTINYETGTIAFVQDMTGREIKPVYYYGGNLTITNGLNFLNAFSLSDIYEYMEYQTYRNNLSEDLVTLDDVTYTFCINLVVGNATVGGTLQDADKYIAFEDGYDVIIGAAGGIIDLAGVGGSGSVENVELTKAVVIPGQTQTAYVSLANTVGDPLTGQTVDASVHYPNGSIWLDGLTFTEFIDGFYKLSFMLPNNNQIPYGAYSVHISGTGFNVVRTFELAPMSNIDITGIEGEETLDLFQSYVEVGGDYVDIPLNLVNKRNDIELNLSQFELWSEHYFVSIPTEAFDPDDTTVYEFSHYLINVNYTNSNIATETQYYNDTISVTASNFTYSGDNTSINITINYSIGTATVCINTTFDTTGILPTQFGMMYGLFYFPDLALDNVTAYIMTDDNNYMYRKGTLKDWKVSQAGWSYVTVFSPELYTGFTFVGTPDPTQITQVRFDFESTADYTTPTSLYIDNFVYEVYNKTPDTRKSFVTEGDNRYVFWWDAGDHFNLGESQTRKFIIRINSPQYTTLTSWTTDYPYDTTIAQYYNDTVNADFYWEQLQAYSGAEAYVYGLSGVKLIENVDINKPKVKPGEMQTIYTSLTNNVGQPQSGQTVTANVYYPNASIFLLNQTATETVNGLYQTNFTMPSDSTTFGSYAVLISGLGFSVVRSFEFIPIQDISVLGPPASAADYFSWLDAKVWDRGTWIEAGGIVRNNHDLTMTLSQEDLYEKNLFISMPIAFNREASTWYVSEQDSETAIDHFENLSLVNYTGEVLNASIDCTDTPAKDHGCVLNVSANFTGGGKSIKLKWNFTSINTTYDFDTEEASFSISIQLPDSYDETVDRIVTRLMTDSDNYYIENKTLRYWKTQYPTWNEIEPYYDSEFSVAVGSPNSDNITSLEIEIFSTETPTDETPTIQIFDAAYKHYATLEFWDMGRKSIGNTYNLFWWDSNHKYTLTPKQERQFFVGLESSYYKNAEKWDAQYPTDPFIQAKVEEIYDAQLYWEQVSAEEAILNYIAGDPSAPYYILSTLGAEYAPEDNARLDILTYDRLGNLLNTTLDVKIEYPNSSIMLSSIISPTATGRYNYSFTIPADTADGDYTVIVTGNYSGYNVTDNTVFQVKNASGTGSATGGLPLNIYNAVGATYAPGNTVYVFSTAMDNNGDLVNASINLSVYLPNGTIYDTPAMTLISEGRLQYNFTLAGDATIGTWRIDFDAEYGTSEVHDNLAFAVSTSAGGGGGGVLPSIQVEAPAVINTNTNFGISAFTRNNNSLLVDCTGAATVTIKDNTNGTTIVNAVAMTNSATGQYDYNTTIPTQSTYVISVSCSISGTTYTSNPKVLSTQNVPGTGGSAYPTIELQASTPIAVLTDASIGALVKSSTGITVDCDADMLITIRDLTNGSIISGNMTNLGTGMYNYTWPTPATASVFYVNTSCAVSSTTYTGFTLLSTRSVGATATIDYNQVATYVWTYTSRNLTYYNQSVADSLQSCLKDAQCSEWWINTTMMSINNTVTTIDATATSIQANANLILSYLNCTTDNELCTRLQGILDNASDIQSRVYSLNVSQIPEIKTIVDNLYQDTQYIKANMTLATALTELQNNVTSILNNITWLVSNVATQENVSALYSQAGGIQNDIDWLKDNAALQANITQLFDRLTGIENNISEIKTTIDCSNPANSDLCTYLFNLDANMTWLIANTATQANITSLLNNITWIQTNMVTQTMFNANITEIKNKIDTVNTSINTILTRTDCTNPANSQLCLYLNQINTTVNSINANMATAAALADLQNNVTWLVNNVATETDVNLINQNINIVNTSVNTLLTRTDCSNPANSELCAYLNYINTTVNTISTTMATATALADMQTNVTWLVQNVATITNITLLNTNINTLITRTDCTNPANSELCAYLNYINTTVNTINANMLTAADLADIQNNVTWLVNNVATQEAMNNNFTDVRSKLVAMNTTIENIHDDLITINASLTSQITEMQTNITWIVNNVATTEEIQANFTQTLSYLAAINNTATNINSYILTNITTSINEINTTTHDTYTYVTGTIQSMLDNITTNVSGINDYLYGEITNRLTELNTTTQNSYTYLQDTINVTLNTINLNTSWLVQNVATQTNITLIQQNIDILNTSINTLLTRTDCTNPANSELCAYLNYINTTVNSINVYITQNMTTKLTELNTSIHELYDYVANNISATTNNTEVLAAIADMQTNLTYIQNNMFYQGNATGAFLVDYLSTVFVEPSNRAELWIVTRDLLGNMKTVSATACNVLRQGTYVANGTVTINTGGVYSYWDIPANQTTSEYYWNCTLTGSTLNMQVPFFVSGTAQQTNIFRISSLEAGSPRYPNEEALIEATFAGQNGSAITPDNITMVIYDPNDNAWATASKTGFTEGTDHVWTRSESIAASPTTGMYTVHLYASYHNISDTRTVQFRIATGGPYKVYLECPTSSYRGQNLACTVKIQDEGEAATESISEIWVDTDGDSIEDAGEPQTSFSKQTQPFQNVTETATINVPASHPTGFYTVRVKTSYVNSAQPDSTASDSVSILATGNETTPGPTGGGAGGGGGPGGVARPPAGINITNEIICNWPYIRHGADCCLDINRNAICDIEDKTESAAEGTTKDRTAEKEKIESTIKDALRRIEDLQTKIQKAQLDKEQQKLNEIKNDLNKIIGLAEKDKIDEANSALPGVINALSLLESDVLKVRIELPAAQLKPINYGSIIIFVIILLMILAGIYLMRSAGKLKKASWKPKARINWASAGKIIAIILILAGIAAGIYFGIGPVKQYLAERVANIPAVMEQPRIIEEPSPIIQIPQAVTTQTTYSIIQDPMFRIMMLIGFIIILLIMLFKSMNLRGTLHFGKEDKKEGTEHEERKTKKKTSKEPKKEEEENDYEPEEQKITPEHIKKYIQEAVGKLTAGQATRPRQKLHGKIKRARSRPTAIKIRRTNKIKTIHARKPKAMKMQTAKIKTIRAKQMPHAKINFSQLEEKLSLLNNAVEQIPPEPASQISLIDTDELAKLNQVSTLLQGIRETEAQAAKAQKPKTSNKKLAQGEILNAVLGFNDDKQNQINEEKKNE